MDTMSTSLWRCSYCLEWAAKASLLIKEDSPREFTELDRTTYHGCVEIIVALLEINKWDVQATDFDGKTVIAWAARKAYQGVINVLPEWSNVSPDIVNALQGRIPRSWATGNGYEGVLRMLLETNEVHRKSG